MGILKSPDVSPAQRRKILVTLSNARKVRVIILGTFILFFPVYIVASTSPTLGRVSYILTPVSSWCLALISVRHAIQSIRISMSSTQTEHNNLASKPSSEQESNSEEALAIRTLRINRRRRRPSKKTHKMTRVTELLRFYLLVFSGLIVQVLTAYSLSNKI